MRLPAPPWIRPSFLTSIWISSPARHADPRQDPRDRRGRHREQLSDLRARKAQPAQRSDRLDALLIGAVGDQLQRRAQIQQTAL
jgi:hypothetical protein